MDVLELADTFAKPLDAGSLVWYNQGAHMSDHASRTACSTQAAGSGRLYAPFYAWRFS